MLADDSVRVLTYARKAIRSGGSIPQGMARCQNSGIIYVPWAVELGRRELQSRLKRATLLPCFDDKQELPRTASRRMDVTSHADADEKNWGDDAIALANCHLIALAWMVKILMSMLMTSNADRDV